MDICNMVKIFASNNLWHLEDQINNWFEENSALLVDVKFNHTVDCANMDYYTAMIIYQ